MNHLAEIGTYWNSRSAGYLAQVEEELKDAGRLSLYAERMKPAAEGKNLRALDLGCGPGFFSVLLSKLGYQVTSVDYSEGMLEKAKELLRQEGAKAELIRADVQHLPLETGAFDLVVSRNMIWNLEKPCRAYMETMRVLKRGGRFVFFDGNHYRYLFDGRYAKAAAAEAGDSRHIMLGVDPAPINKIAESLPLSPKDRPAWDSEIASQIGFRNVRTEVLSYWKLPGELLQRDFVIEADKAL